MIFFTKNGTVGQDILSLTAIETTSPYLFFQSGRPQGQHLFRRIVFREHAGRHDIDPFVCALCRQDDSNHQFKRRMIVQSRFHDAILVLEAL